MENTLNELEAEKMITLLKYEIKKDFIKESTDIKTAKQLNFFLKSKDKKGVEIRERFETFTNSHPLKETIDAFNNGEAFLPDTTKDIVESLIDKAKAFAEKDQKKPEFKKTKNAETNGKVLDRIHDYYKSKLEEAQNGTFKGKWVKPWTSDNVITLPRNFSGRVYNIENAAILLQEQQAQDLPVAVFMNRSELLSFDIEPDILVPAAHIIKKSRFHKKEENGKKITIFDNEYNELSKDEQSEYETVYFNKSEPLYHPEQIKSVSMPIYEMIKTKIPEYKILEDRKANPEKAKKEYDENMRRALQDLFSYVADQGITLSKKGDVCAYSPDRDHIFMVDDSNFTSTLEYIGTFAHEVCHSTGNKDRNNRNLTGNFGSSNYGFEELVAEMGSRYFMAKYGLPAAIDEQSAAYINSWFTKLTGTENKKIGLFNSASKQALEATKLINQCAERYQNSPDFDFEEIKRLSNQIMANSLTVGDNELNYDTENPLRLDENIDLSQSYDKLQKISHNLSQVDNVRKVLSDTKKDEDTVSTKISALNEKMERAKEMLGQIKVTTDRTIKNK